MYLKSLIIYRHTPSKTYTADNNLEEENEKIESKSIFVWFDFTEKFYQFYLKKKMKYKFYSILINCYWFRIRYKNIKSKILLLN